MINALSKFPLTLMGTVVALLLPSQAAPHSGQETVPIRRPLLRSVRFVDDSNGWIAGYNGVFSTSDGGRSWRRLRVSLGSISKFSITAARDVGRVVWADKDGAIFRNDSGLTHVTCRPLKWIAVPIATDPLVHINTIEFADRKHGFASGTLSHELFRTTDGGLSWDTFDTPADDILQGLFVASSSEVWVVGVEGIVLHTTDSGQTWGHIILTNSNGEPATGLRSVFFIDSMKGWICGPSGSIFHTIDGGKNWLRQTTPFTENLPLSFNAVSFATDSEGWVVGEYCADYVEQKYQAIVLHTTDGGRHWDWQWINLNQSLLDVQALPHGSVWAVGEKGTVIRTVDHGKHWVPAQFGPSARTVVFPEGQ